mgnify:CR=1 FL=1
MTNPGNDPLNPQMLPGQSCQGFEIQKVSPLAAIGGFYYNLTHRATGARYIHISRDDGENAFGVALKTVPHDASGVAHILEHTVLCGSEAYPVPWQLSQFLKARAEYGLQRLEGAILDGGDGDLAAALPARTDAGWSVSG